MNKSTKVRLVKLNAKLSQHVTEFGGAVDYRGVRRDDEGNVRRGGALVGAGALAAGGLYLRGRKALKDSNLPVGEGGRPGIFDTMKVGGSALRSDATMAYTGAKAGVSQGINATKTAGGQILAKGKGALADVAAKGKTAGASVLDASKKALLKGQGRLALARM